MNKVSRFLSVVIRVLVILAIIGAGVFVFQTCAGTSLITKIDKTIPSVEVAPLQVVTLIKTYYAQQATVLDDGSVEMISWYDRINGKWVLQKSSIILPQVIHPVISKR